jgi:hypothetical protein
MGASSTVPCQFAVTTNTWLLTQVRVEFLAGWKDELPLANPSFKFSAHLHGVDWTDIRAMWRVFCNRSPRDSPPNIPAEPYACGLSLNTSYHLLQNYSMLATQRATLLHSTTGDIQTPDFLTTPNNALQLRQVLRKTRQSHSSRLQFDGDDHNQPGSADIPDSDLPEPDFGAFEL